ncbi:MAG TPA: IspD/TarI family cytidylyltransferase [Acidimicrobiales bacterium]|nr:IspD/TarI family cytidylyltransferase [Acidimicrobiales bacterium]
MRPEGEVWAVIVAAGSGSRFGAYKQFASLRGHEVVEWSLRTAGHVCDGTVLVVPAELRQQYLGRASRVVGGGQTRPASVRAGIEAVPAEVAIVAVHDAARPLASVALWEAVIAAVRQGAEAAVPCLPVTDTIKQRRIDGGLVTLERDGLVAAQTPQAFLATALRAAHAGGSDATDDAALVEAKGGRVVEVLGEVNNLKITSHVDLMLAEALLEQARHPTGPLPPLAPARADAPL